MPTNFPSGTDSFANPTATSPRNNPSLASLISNIGDAVEALQARVGTTGSADATSLDYILKSTVGGHAHTGSGTDGRAVAWNSLSGKPTTFAPSTHAHSSHSGIGADDHHAERHGAAKHAFSGARMNGGSQSTSNNTVAALDFTTSAYEVNGAYCDLVANRFDVPVAGYYRVTARAAFASDNSGSRRLRILVNGSSYDAVQVAAVTDNNQATVLSVWTGTLTTSDKVGADVLQTSGRTLSVSSSSLDIEFLGTP